MKLHTTVFALFCCALLAASVAMAQPVVIGEHVSAKIETPHPYPAGRAAGDLVWSEEIHFPGATYIAPHFARFELGEGDSVVVRSPDGEQSWTYEGLGKMGLGASGGFFAAHIKGDTAVVELYSKGAFRGFGFVIDYYGRGYSNAEIEEFWALGLGEVMNLPYPASATESLCTVDDTMEAKCYMASEPVAYDRSRTVARLLINGFSLCTGWLVGCEGHLMTNQHCIGSASAAANTDYEFMAEGATCAVDCRTTLGCPGTVEATGGALVAVDAALDYSLVLPDTSTVSNTDLAATYGFLQLRETGAVLDERIYIPQHPAGWGKRIALESTYPADTDGFPHAVSLSEPACSGGPGDVGYWADTQGGSSGSPVLAYEDHKVVALHHCRGSAFCNTGNPAVDDPNRGVPIDAVIADLGANLPQCALGAPELEQVFQQETVSNFVYVQCPTGKKALGGGCLNNSPTSHLQSSLPLTSPPFGLEGWICIYDSNPGSITAYAQCADDGVSLGRELVQQSQSTSNVSFVYCPAGKQVISSGCVGNADLRGILSYFSGPSELSLCVHESNPGSLTAYGLCVDSDIDFGRELLSQTITTGTVPYVLCPSGKSMISGGCLDSGAGAPLGSALAYSLAPTELYLCQYESNPGSLTAYGLCIE